MENKMSKRGEATLFKMLFAVIGGITIFFGIFQFYSYQAGLSSTPLDPSISGMNSQMSSLQANLSINIEDVRNQTLGISEQRTGLGGLIVGTVEGFSAVIKLLMHFISFPLNFISILITGASLPFPDWATALLTMALIALVLKAGLKAISGRSEI